MVKIISTSEKSPHRARQSNGTSKNKFHENSKRFSLRGKRDFHPYLMGCVLIILLPSLKLNAQSNFRKYIVSSSLLFAGGCSDGLAETMQFHYLEFKKAFPNSNDQFWDPSISWENKYKNNNPEDGPKYFGSTTVFVGFTDSYHMSRMLRNSFVFGAITFKIGEPKQKWYYYVGEFIAGGIIYKAGFWSTYEIMFHD